MGLRDIHAEQTEAQRPCKIRHYLTILKGDDHDWLEEALENLDASTISRILSKGGYGISPATVQRHLRGVCSCA